jgi:hypothetical protein
VLDVTAGSEPKAPVTVVFDVDDAALLEPDSGLFVGYHEGADGPEYLPAEVDAAARTVSVETASLSPIGWLHIDASGVRGQFKKVLDEFFGGAFEGAPTPKCDNEDAARTEGWSITSSSYDTVAWCFGIEDGKHIVDVVNKRRYPLIVDVPAGATFVSRSDRGFAERVSESLLPDDQLVLAGGAEATWAVEPAPGRTLAFKTDFDGLAQAIGSVEVAAEWLAVFAAKVPGGPKGGKAALLAAIENSGCLKALVGNTDASNSFDAGDVFDLVQSCLGYSTLKAWGGSFFAAVIAAPVALVFGTADYFRGAWQGFTNSLSGKVRYEIKVSRAKPKAPTGGAELVLGVDRIGDIEFGANGEDARRRLVAALGETSEPDSQLTMTECQPIPSTILRWGDFWVGLVGPPGDQTLSGYELFGEGDRRLATARGVTVGERYEDFMDGFANRPSVSITEDSTYVLDVPGPKIEMGGQEFGDRAVRIGAGVLPACYE